MHSAQDHLAKLNALDASSRVLRQAHLTVPEDHEGPGYET